MSDFYWLPFGLNPSLAVNWHLTLMSDSYWLPFGLNPSLALVHHGVWPPENTRPGNPHKIPKKF
jgi:hypothetical protein